MSIIIANGIVANGIVADRVGVANQLGKKREKRNPQVDKAWPSYTWPLMLVHVRIIVDHGIHMRKTEGNFV